MQRDDILEFLQRIDIYLQSKRRSQFSGKKFELKIFGKSALLLAGLTDSFGTVDVDLLKIEGQVSSEDNEIIDKLKAEFGRAKVHVNGYYLEFVSSSLVLLPSAPVWVPVEGNYECLLIHYLAIDYVVASKLFSAFSDTPRRQDKQDIVAALDQKMVNLQRICEIADQIFEGYKFDSRNDRFSDVYNYITNELMADYGKADLSFEPEE